MNELEKRYDDFFGEGTSKKLLRKQRELYSIKNIRVNTSKTSSKKIEEYLKQKKVIFEKGFLPNSYTIKKTFFPLATSIPALTSEIYLQELASQLPVHLIDFKNFKNKIRVLDMAASPGSKLTQLVDTLNTLRVDYEITALEPNSKRHQRLINTIQKQEAENITIINTSGENYESKKQFDLILLDAPCSGNLITDPDWIKKRNTNGILKNSQLQKRLLENASKLLAKNGFLVYSTCSIEPEENEDNILWTKENLELKEVEPKFKFPFKIKPKEIFNTGYKEKYEEIKSVRMMPYESNSQGFFVSLFRKE